MSCSDEEEDSLSSVRMILYYLYLLFFFSSFRPILRTFILFFEEESIEINFRFLTFIFFGSNLFRHFVRVLTKRKPCLFPYLNVFIFLVFKKLKKKLFKCIGCGNNNN